MIEKLGIIKAPWRWFGTKQKNTNRMMLASNHSGRQYIMGFERCGMQGALPVLRTPLSDGLEIMERCDNLGDETDHNGEYTLNNTYAKLIENIPEMLEALIEVCLDFDILKPENRPAVHLKRIKVIEKATNKSWDEIKELIK